MSTSDARVPVLGYSLAAVGVFAGMCGLGVLLASIVVEKIIGGGRPVN